MGLGRREDDLQEENAFCKFDLYINSEHVPPESTIKIQNDIIREQVYCTRHTTIYRGMLKVVPKTAKTVHLLHFTQQYEQSNSPQTVVTTKLYPQKLDHYLLFLLFHLQVRKQKWWHINKPSYFQLGTSSMIGKLTGSVVDEVPNNPSTINQPTINSDL